MVVAAPPPSPPGLIVFDQISLDGQRTFIFRERGDGSGRVLVLRNGWDPVWSPDGRFIAAFQGQIITVATRGGRVVRRVRTVGSTAYLTWSPDGRRIAFATLKGLVVSDVPRDGGTCSARPRGSRRSPTGHRTAGGCSTRTAARSSPQHRTEAIAGSCAARATRFTQRGRRTARGSPTSGAYTATTGACSSPRRTAAHASSSGRPKSDSPLVWSPDGRFLLLGVAGDDRFEIFRADGRGRPRFIRGGEDGDWGP
jgi:hypothetical protein